MMSAVAPEPFATRRRVEFRDTDAAGIAHFSAFFFWMESVEHELLRRVDVAVVERHTGGTPVSWPRVSVACDYKSAVRFDDQLNIFVGVDEIGRSSVAYAFRFEHNGAWVAQGRVVAVRCLMHAECKPEAVAIPPEIIAKLKPFQART